MLTEIPDTFRKVSQKGCQDFPWYKLFTYIMNFFVLNTAMVEHEGSGIARHAYPSADTPCAGLHVTVDVDDKTSAGVTRGWI